MDIAEKRERALGFLYDHYAGTGQAGGRVAWEKAQRATGLTQRDLARAYRELAEEGLVAGIPGGGAGMRPEDGFLWISAHGRDAVERRRREAKGAPTPPNAPVGLAGATPEGREHFAALLARASADERARFERLLAAALDENRPEKDRLEQAANLVALVRGSATMTAAFVGAAYPQLAPLLRRVAEPPLGG